MIDIIGIFLGVLGWLVPFNFPTFLRDVILLPLAQRSDPQSININTKWIIEDTGLPADGEGLELKWKTIAEIKRTGRKISGKATAICLNGGEIRNSAPVHYNIDGSITNNLIELRLIDTSRTRINRTLHLLNLTGNGCTFEGYRTFLGRIDHRIRTVPCIWRRMDEHIVNSSNCESA